ncbi:MAG: hypothetical protein RMY33_004480 [Nostoc sp. DedQUE03]|nr:hypothetical protein [Nostoc sp. DedQUE03]MDZ8043787.1 hypothetical protein [Nostoc sp. DedQUE02]
MLNRVVLTVFLIVKPNIFLDLIDVAHNLSREVNWINISEGQ